ncbi:MAG: tetratricopeptide repeat protein [Sideroxyarcus sp.]|nr:tetratricopeptide repeat protein [Sideroxyarcus sp.]
MQSTTYEFTARSKAGIERPKLMSGWTLAGFAVLVLIPLVMIFPKQSLLRQASQQRLGDPLTVSYLGNLLRAEPGNIELRLLLAEHKTHLGDTEGVAELIQPALESADPTRQANGLLAEYKLVLALLAKENRYSAQYRSLLSRATEIFVRLSNKPWSLPTLVYLAGQADRLQERGVSVLLYRAIEDASRSVSVDWLAAAAARSLAKGEHGLAAHLYFLARHREYTISGQRAYLLAGIRALMWGGFYDRAMQAIDQHVGNLEHDDETLYSLVRVAREANDQERAIRYTKRLLHLSWLGEVWAWVRDVDLRLLGIADAEAEEQQEIPVEKIRAYDPRTYQLAYDVFMSNSKLEDAFRVAEAAVRQSPKEKIWHKRLAELAEWLGRPEIALREWKWLLKRDGSRTALLAVLRLAPMLNDYDALLDGWKSLAVSQDPDDVQSENMVSLFEQTGRHREGSRYFEERYAANHRAAHLEIAARLAEHGGDDDRARRLYFRLLDRHGANADLTIKIVNIYLRKGEYQKAYDLLQKNRSHAGEKDSDYWKALADLAWQLQQDSDALNSYRHLSDTGKLAREDIVRLIYLLGDSKQEEKAALAELAYRRFDDRDMLLRALEIYAARGDMAAQRRLFENVAARGNVDLSGTPRYYLLRAEYQQANGDFAAARADYRRAVAISPDDPVTVNGIMWFLIDGHDEAGLREMIALIVARGEQNEPAYWGVLAAAYQVIGQPTRAVAYYTRLLKQEKQDFLWLVNYADALQQARQEGLADRVRQQAWQQLKVRLSDKPLALPFPPDMLAAARLSMMNHPGDPALALVRSVLRQDRLVERNAATDLATSELVLGWSVSTERSPGAKAWLWQRYGRSLKRPLWAEASVALADEDRTTLDGLVATQADGLSGPVLRDALKTLGRTGEARAVAYAELENDPESATAHAHLTEDALAAASFVDAGMRQALLGSLHQFERYLRLDMPLDHDTRIAVEYARTGQSDDDTSEFATVPPRVTVGGIALKHRGKRGDTELAVRRRNELSHTTEAELKHSTDILSRSTLQFGVEFHTAATDSSLLRELAMRNRVSTALLYSISKRDHLYVDPGWARYYMHGGEYLGSGKNLAWELGHRFRTEYPDWKVRLIGAHTRFAPIAAAPIELPADSNLYGACLGVGEARRLSYARMWLPYLDYCYTYNDVSGSGYNAGLGLAGPVVGADQLSLNYGLERGGVDSLFSRSYELELNYRYYFD